MHRITCGLWALMAAIISMNATAIDRLVRNSGELRSALTAAVAGDSILLAPGTYAGGASRAGLNSVTIRGLDASNPAIVRGGKAGLYLSDAANVVISDLVIENASINGINIDDGGSFATPSSNITLRNLVVRNVGSTGNHDGIKLSGVTGFSVENVRVVNWGDGGSAVDMVGSHNGLIQNSLFRHDAIGPGGSGIRPKGGSKNIVIRANRVELPGPNGRPIQAGGSTEPQYFRFIDGDSGYEADSITIEGNVISGGVTGVSFVNIDGGNAHHNAIAQPGRWILRILNESPGLVETRNGIFADNIVLFDNRISFEFINVGPRTAPSTLRFARNRWFNVENASKSHPRLPVLASNSIVGVDPKIDLNGVIAWRFDWGLWLVNAFDGANTYTLQNPRLYKLALPGPGASFDPLLPNPLIGSWRLMPVSDAAVRMQALSQAVLFLSVP